MEFTRLIEALAGPGAYPFPVDDVEVHHTHISVVFLAGPFAYKVRKPVNLGFLDFSTPERRRHDCEEEVRLNRRLAPRVYLGVVPVAQTETGVRVEGDGPVVEWAVKMERLPPDATLRERLRRGAVGAAWVEALAERVAGFHRAAPADGRGAAFGSFETVAGNARENLEQSAGHVGTTLSRAVHGRLQSLLERALTDLRPLIEGRARRGVPREVHGDLHLEHVYLFPDRPAPDDLVIVDCIEFNERFRFTDPVADMAFLVMDLTFQGRRDLARRFADAYFRASGDEEGRALVPFYAAYRAAVRGKVEGFKLAEPEVPDAERRAALEQARGHWLLALGELEAPGRRPALVLVSGLPGTGKSTLSKALADRAGFHVIRSDVVRKELAGVPGTAQKPTVMDGGIYTPAWTDRTYAECLRRAEAFLFEGERVVVDATFLQEAKRRTFLDAARRWGVPGVMFVCQAEPAVVRRRLAGRHGDASDADWAVYQQAAERWEEPGELTRAAIVPVPTGGGPEGAISHAFAALTSARL